VATWNHSDLRHRYGAARGGTFVQGLDHGGLGKTVLGREVQVTRADGVHEVVSLARTLIEGAGRSSRDSQARLEKDSLPESQTFATATARPVEALSYSASITAVWARPLSAGRSR
jgi:hypothetical protein